MADTNKSSSLEQQRAEDEMFCMVEDWLGCKVSRNPKVKMCNNDSVHIEPDFYSEEHSIIGEIFAHIGENKRGQSTKIANEGSVWCGDEHYLRITTKRVEEKNDEEL